MENFIGRYNIEEDVCDKVVKYFYKNKTRHVNGTIGKGDVAKDKKDSTDIAINGADGLTPLLKEYFEELSFCLNKYKKKYIYSDVDQARYNLNGCNIQKYNPGGGFKQWHYENNGERNERHLVFMTYLNTCKAAGTMFYYQNKTFKCKKGDTLIWPAAWTHTHKGQISTTETKYIITGWYCYG